MFSGAQPVKAPTLLNVGVGEPHGLNTFVMTFGLKRLADSMIGGITETQTVIDHCFAHGVSPDIDVSSPSQINGALVRVVNKDVRHRFVINFASMKDAVASTPGKRTVQATLWPLRSGLPLQADRSATIGETREAQIAAFNAAIWQTANMKSELMAI